MRLYDFIQGHREHILAEWESFARTVSPASGTMDVVALRDHADEMLTVIAADLRTAQNPVQQAEKSKGQAEDSDTTATAAEEHGAARAESGFTIEEMVAEYRALRASVLSLWTREAGVLKAEHIDDLIRFNEAIDQSLAESVTEFNAGRPMDGLPVAGATGSRSGSRRTRRPRRRTLSGPPSGGGRLRSRRCAPSR
jgi:hypothetical protein